MNPSPSPLTSALNSHNPTPSQPPLKIKNIKFLTGEYLDKVKEEFGYLETYFQTSRQELEQLNNEKTDLQRQLFAVNFFPFFF